MERVRIQLVDNSALPKSPGVIVKAARTGKKDVGAVNGDAVEPRAAVGELHDRGVPFFFLGKDGDGRGDGTGMHDKLLLSRDLQLDAVDLRRFAELLLFHDVVVSLNNTEERRILDLRVVVHDDDEAGSFHRGGELDGVVPEVDPAGIIQKRALGDQGLAAPVVDFHLLVEILCSCLDPQARELCVAQIGRCLRGRTHRNPHGSVRERFEAGDGRGNVRSVIYIFSFNNLFRTDDKRAEFTIRAHDADAGLYNCIQPQFPVDIGVDREGGDVLRVFGEDDVLVERERGGLFLLAGESGRGRKQEARRGGQEFEVITDGFHRTDLLSVQTGRTARPRR